MKPETNERPEYIRTIIEDLITFSNKPDRYDSGTQLFSLLREARQWLDGIGREMECAYEAICSAASKPATVRGEEWSL